MKFGIGQSMARVEDQRLFQGTGQFVDDALPAGTAAMVFLRSPYPRARLVSIDAAAARTADGVIGIVTGADLLAAGVTRFRWCRACPMPRANRGPRRPTTRWPLTRCDSSARPSPRSSPRRARRPRLPPSSSSSTTKSCPASPRWRPRAPPTRRRSGRRRRAMCSRRCALATRRPAMTRSPRPRMSPRCLS